MILHTDRLTLRNFTEDDAAFMLTLFNDAAFVRFIGDKGVRTEEEARAYLANYYIASYSANGFGPYLVTLKETGEPIGMCGLLKRAWLADPDIGYAFMEPWRGRGYAGEATRAIVKYAGEAFGLKRLVAIIDLENSDSVKLINNAGFAFESMVREAADKKELGLYALDTAVAS